MRQYDMNIHNAMDELYIENLDYGYCIIHLQLLEDAYSIGEDRVLKYMGILGIQTMYLTKRKQI